ncbi:hypothetical protein CHS0354_007036 [Potamilus streckersoni]|uniref:Uncharacterized protein n=1 Tax=Potamilus streckersoni TaxID=2493646 RepID=A0AAE0SBE4_9BIVA|nr:hypothetical protein CHS0354_007036 [Potamilus streckersoni]
MADSFNGLIRRREKDRDVWDEGLMDAVSPITMPKKRGLLEAVDKITMFGMKDCEPDHDGREEGFFGSCRQAHDVWDEGL